MPWANNGDTRRGEDAVRLSASSSYSMLSAFLNNSELPSPVERATTPDSECSTRLRESSDNQGDKEEDEWVKLSFDAFR